MTERVIISNGHGKFILAPLAAGLEQVNLLSAYATGVYPKGSLKSCSQFVHIKYLAKIFSLREPGIPDIKIWSFVFSELLHQFATLLARLRLANFSDIIETIALISFSNSCAAKLKGGDAGFYHYRSGYGGKSVKIAKKMGMKVICDHSIANPEVLDYLVDNGGRWPKVAQKPRTRKWRLVLTDLREADHIVVNSHFVKETFTRYGWGDQRIYVNYSGLDAELINNLPAVKLAPGAPLRVLYAGEFSQRKGVHYFEKMLKLVQDINFEFTIISNVAAEMAPYLADLKKDKRVKFNNYMPRSELLKCMSEADIFIFPSLAEGSARVVFYAMACGCFVITTPNAGSVVADGVNGRCVTPGSPAALAVALREACLTPDRCYAIGMRNRQMILSHYTHDEYLNESLRIYNQVSIAPN